MIIYGQKRIKGLKAQDGQSLAEIIIALAIFSFLAVLVSKAVLGGIIGLSQSEKTASASFLADEALEALINIRDSSWNRLVYSQSGLEAGSGFWELSGEGTSSNINGFMRKIELFPVYRDSAYEIAAASDPNAFLDLETKEAKATVSWSNGAAGTSSISKSLLISNWGSFLSTQSDWSGGGGQSEFIDASKYYSDDGRINASTAGNISLAPVSSSTYETIGYLVSSAFDLGAEASPGIIYADWSRPDNCPVCDVRLQLQSAADAGGTPGSWTTSWSGPDGNDGDEDDFYSATTTGALIHFDHNDKRWLRYKTILTGNGVSTPELREIRIDHKR